MVSALLALVPLSAVMPPDPCALFAFVFWTGVLLTYRRIRREKSSVSLEKAQLQNTFDASLVLPCVSALQYVGALRGLKRFQAFAPAWGVAQDLRETRQRLL
jgi:hypothetical protein